MKYIDVRRRWVQQRKRSRFAMRSQHARAGLLVLLMFSAPFAGCFGENGAAGLPDAEDLVVQPDLVPGGEWTTIDVKAARDMSVILP